MKKRAQGLSINVIIIVAVALIVLVVLIAIFTGRLGGFSRGVDAAQTCSNTCAATGSDRINDVDLIECAKQGKYFPGKFGDVTKGVCCCKSRGGTGSGGGSAGTGSGTAAASGNTGGGAEGSGAGAAAGGSGEDNCGLSGGGCCISGTEDSPVYTCKVGICPTTISSTSAPNCP